jgi:hypothetical protein
MFGSLRRSTALRKHDTLHAEAIACENQLKETAVQANIIKTVAYEGQVKEPTVSVSIIETGPYESKPNQPMTIMGLVEVNHDAPQGRAEHRILDHRPRLSSREFSFKNSPEMGIKVGSIILASQRPCT